MIYAVSISQAVDGVSDATTEGANLVAPSPTFNFREGPTIRLIRGPPHPAQYGLLRSNTALKAFGRADGWSTIANEGEAGGRSCIGRGRLQCVCAASVTVRLRPLTKTGTHPVTEAGGRRLQMIDELLPLRFERGGVRL